MIYNDLLFLVVSNCEIIFQNLLLLFNNSKPNIMETPIVIENGKIFIESRETTNPTEIGYAIIDAIQEGYKVSIEKHQHDFDFIFKNKDLVYLIHDEEQLPRMILSNIIEDSCVKYELISGTTVSIHNGFELTKTKMVY